MPLKSPDLTAITIKDLRFQINEALRDVFDSIESIYGVDLKQFTIYNNIDANGFTVQNLPDPVDDGDAVPLGWFDDVMDASFLVLSADAELPNERAWANGNGIQSTDAGAGGAFTVSVKESEIDHSLLKSLNSTNYTHLTAAHHTDLTDGGATTLHSHSGAGSDHGLLGGLLDDDHTQYLLRTQWLQNGFVDATEVALSWSDANRKLTVSPVAASFRYFHDGILYTKTVPVVSTAITDTEGLWAFYFDGATLSSINSPTEEQIDGLIDNECIVALVYWDATNNDGRMFSELHGYRMSPATHHWLHDNVGAVYKTGMAITDLDTDDTGGLDQHAQFGVYQGEFYDEDLEIELDTVGSTTGLEVWYLSGSDWRWTTNAGFSVLTTGTGRLAWNDSGAQTEAGNGKFVLCHVFASNCTDDAGANFKYIAIQGQAEYATIAAARIGADVEINYLATGALPMPELVPVGTVIFQTQDSYANSVNARTRSTATGDDYVDWRFSNIVATGASADHGTLSGLADDDHPGYPFSVGRAGGQSLSGGTVAADALALLGSEDAAGGPITLNTNLSVGDEGDPTLTKISQNATFKAIVYGAGVRGEYVGYRALGTDPADVVENDSGFVRFQGYGWDGSDFTAGAEIGLLAASTWGAAEAGGKIKFRTVLIGDLTRTLADRATIDGYGNFLLGTSNIPTSMSAGLALKTTTAPTAVAADMAALYTADVNGATGHSFLHAMGEDDEARVLVGCKIITAGDPAAADSHAAAMYLDTTADKVKLYCEKGGAAMGWNELLFVEDANFRSYKAIAMCCDNGTVFPTSLAPATGQWFYRSDTKTLWFYEAAWKAIISFGAFSMYVSKAGGDEPPDGWTGDAPLLTVQEAVNRIPSIIGGHIDIYIGAGTYAESISIGGKQFSGSYNIRFWGALTEDASTTLDATGVTGTGATQGSCNDTGGFTGHAGKLLYIATRGGYRIIDSVTADVATITGTFSSQPVSGDAYKIYSWGTILQNITFVAGQTGVQFFDLDFSHSSTQIYASSKAGALFTRCRFNRLIQGLYGSVLDLTCCLSSVTAAGQNMWLGGFAASTCQLSKFYNSVASVAMFNIINSELTLTSGCIVDAYVKTGGSTGVQLTKGAALSCYSAAANGNNQIRKCNIGISATSGGKAANTSSNTYTDNNADETAASASDWGYID